MAMKKYIGHGYCVIVHGFNYSLHIAEDVCCEPSLYVVTGIVRNNLSSALTTSCIDWHNVRTFVTFFIGVSINYLRCIRMYFE